MKAPERLDTARLILRRPRADDAEAVFARYASDPDVTRFVGWPRHLSVDETRTFLRFSDAEWARWPAGPYLIVGRDDSRLLGGTGLAFETARQATTGYVLATDAWGRGLATEALRAMIDLARRLGVERLCALCHPDHRKSGRVLEKGGFTLEEARRRCPEFPNLQPGVPVDALCYAMALDPEPMV